MWKFLLLAWRVRRGWKRIPPERRRRLVVGAGRTIRTHGPTVARRVGTTIRDTRARR